MTGGASVLGVGLLEVLGGEAGLAASRAVAEEVLDDSEGEPVEDLLVGLLSLFCVPSRNSSRPGESIEILSKWSSPSGV